MCDLQILPPKKKKSKSKNGINDNLPQPPFLLCCVAPSQSGKSTVLLNIVLNPLFGYYDYFDTIYYFSPTVEFDKTLTGVMEEKKKIITITESDDLDNISGFVSEIIEEQKKNDENILMIFDDCVGYFSNDSYLSFLSLKYRHFRTSLIFTSQNFRSIPLKVRVNSGYFLIWKLFNHKEIDKIMEEIGENFEDFKFYYEYATEQKYNFLYIDNNRKRLYKNFDELIYSQ